MKKIIEVMENKKFYVTKQKSYWEIETWTDKGVNMIVYIDKNESLISGLEKYLNDFDIDEEIDLHRQDQRYKDHFTIKESLKDFEGFVSDLESLIKELKEV